MAYRELTESETARIYELVEAKASYPDIHRELGITADHLKQVLFLLGIEKPRAPSIAKSGPEKQAAMALYEAKKASAWHLIDLKRAGHSPLQTELRITPEGLGARFIPEPLVSYRSPAAMLAEG